eukprot:SAG11_NODE_29017_length_315_cov_0.958333_1_plen_43_part_01
MAQSYHDRLQKLAVTLSHDLSAVPTFVQLLQFVPTCEGHMNKM